MGHGSAEAAHLARGTRIVGNPSWCQEPKVQLVDGEKRYIDTRTIAKKNSQEMLSRIDTRSILKVNGRGKSAKTKARAISEAGAGTFDARSRDRESQSSLWCHMRISDNEFLSLEIRLRQRSLKCSLESSSAAVPQATFAFWPLATLASRKAVARRSCHDMPCVAMMFCFKG